MEWVEMERGLSLQVLRINRQSFHPILPFLARSSPDRFQSLCVIESTSWHLAACSIVLSHKNSKIATKKCFPSNLNILERKHPE